MERMHHRLDCPSFHRILTKRKSIEEHGIDEDVKVDVSVIFRFDKSLGNRKHRGYDGQTERVDPTLEHDQEAHSKSDTGITEESDKAEARVCVLVNRIARKL